MMEDLGGGFGGILAPGALGGGEVQEDAEERR